MKTVEKNGYTLYKQGRKIVGWVRGNQYGFGSPFRAEISVFTAETTEAATRHFLESIA